MARDSFHTAPQTTATQTVPVTEGNSQDYPVQLRSHMDLRRNLAWDVSASFVDPLDGQGPLSNVRIPSYTRLDSGLTWKLGEGFSLSVVGQNLLKGRHLEFEDSGGSMQSGLVKRRA